MDFSKYITINADAIISPKKEQRKTDRLFP
nr:MAG TPA: hypothetical protein [Caudoviricetes sp.]